MSGRSTLFDFVRYPKHPLTVGFSALRLPSSLLPRLRLDTDRPDCLIARPIVLHSLSDSRASTRRVEKDDSVKEVRVEVIHVNKIHYSKCSGQKQWADSCNSFNG
ncbi:hypothetical protein L1987_33266 [Smallanthus sonchifolius]|uniref:Uncharacterized protein n=1 Tax=Smallanthus sonchifolius TaxID=185202 RepID=A0ACB9HQK6_9ASTR|nr:hypothetical protein L1987_33266 [Smallanthus sonchifolius]